MFRFLPAALALTLLALVGLTGTAWAHAHLKSAVPAVGSTVATAPAELHLKFTEEVSLAFSGIELTGPGGPVVLGKAKLKPDDATTLIVPLTGELAPGRYQVEWHAFSDDGHKSHGSYSFTVKS